jgi:hypothetical protein
VSSVLLQAVYTEEVAITTGGAERVVPTAAPLAPWTAPEAGDRQILYTSGFPLSGAAAETDAYFGVVESPASSCAGRSGYNTAVSTPVAGPGGAGSGGSWRTTACYTPASRPVLDWSLSQFNANSAAERTLSADNLFQFFWDAATSNATGDFAQPTAVSWRGRLRYADQSTKLVGAWVAPHAHVVSTGPGAVTASTSRSMNGGASNASISSSSLLGTATIAVAAAAAALIAVVAAVLVTVARRRKALREGEVESNLESVTMSVPAPSASTELTSVVS